MHDTYLLTYLLMCSRILARPLVPPYTIGWWVIRRRVWSVRADDGLRHDCKQRRGLHRNLSIIATDAADRRPIHPSSSPSSSSSSCFSNCSPSL